MLKLTFPVCNRRWRECLARNIKMLFGIDGEKPFRTASRSVIFEPRIFEFIMTVLQARSICLK